MVVLPTSGTNASCRTDAAKDEDFKDETTFSADPLIIDKQHDNEVNSPSSSSMLENLLVGKPSEMANKRNMQCRDGTDKKYLKENKSSIKGAAISPAFSGDTQFHHFPIKPFQKQKGQVKDRNKCEMLDDLTANSKSKQKHTTNTRHSHVKGKTSEYCRKTSMTGGVLKHLLLQTSLEKLYSGNRHEQSFEVDLPEEDNCANNQYEDCNDEDMHISTDESKHKKKLLSAGQENDDLNPTNIHTGDIFCQCPDCLKDFKTINSLQKRSKQNKTRIKLRPTCKICKKSFHRNNALEKHVENVHKGNKQVCKICCKAFNADYFQIHMKTQHSSVKSIRSYNCSKCDKSFSTKQILDKHVWDIHNNAAKVLRGSYSCDVCGKNLSSKKHLGNHKKNKHSSSKEEFICAHCDQKYKTKSSIKAHMKNVHLPPTHKCKMCDLLFNSTTTLKKHLLVQHSVGKVPSFVCETCGKAFNYKQKLEYHMTTSHSVAHKQFKCRHCEKSFFTKIHLNQHSLVHSDDRNFNCGLCDKGFKLKHHLKQHMAVHGLESIPDYRKKMQCRDDTGNVNKKQTNLSRKGSTISLALSGSTQLYYFPVIDSQKSKGPVKQKRIYKSKTCDPLQTRNTHHNLGKGNKNSCKFRSKTFRTKRNLKQHSLVHKDEEKLYSNDNKKEHDVNGLSDGGCCDYDPDSLPLEESELTNKVPLGVDTAEYDRKPTVNIHTGDIFCQCSDCVKVFKIVESDVCGKHCNRKESLSNHKVKKHSLNKKEFICAHCDSKFKFRSTIISHMIHAHLPPTVKCNMCESLFHSTTTLNQHLVDQHSAGEQFVCETCGKTFGSKQRLKIHVKTSRGDRKFKCQHCEKSFPRYSNLIQHAVVHSDLYNFSCELCDKSFKWKHNLKKHIKVHAQQDAKKLMTSNINKSFLDVQNDSSSTRIVHTDDIFCQCSDCVNAFKTLNSPGPKMKIQPKNILTKARPICEICKHSFNRNAALNKHMRTVHKGNKQVCKICCRAFAKDYLPYHMKTQHSSAKSVQAFNCSMCDKSFTSKNGLNSHLKYIHNKVAQDLRGLYTCDVCGKQFNRKESLSNHKVQKHSLNKKEFICAHCDSKFEFRGTIISHMIHAHLPPTVKCNMCESLFHSATTLNQHLVNEHSAGEPFVCETCGKTFGSKNQVNKHVKISHGDRKFQCQHCEKSFPQYRDLIQHAVVHSDVYNFRCELCDKPFKWKHNLKTHIKVHAQHEAKQFIATNKTNERFLDVQNDSLRTRIIHTGDIFCQCSDCVKGFKSLNTSGPNMRLQPMNTLTKARAICEICEHSFHRTSALNQHMRAVHKANRQVCKICCRAFSESYFAQHMKTQHSNVEPDEVHNCIKCDKSFKRKRLLDAHLRNVHNYAANVLKGSHSCDLCGKNLSSKKNLTRHRLEVHNVYKREFVCAHCDRKFKSRACISAHMNKHHLPPTHKCKMCDLLFRGSETLKRHLLVQHSVGKVQSFVCESCGKYFKQKYHLDYHMKTSHPVADKKFKCKHCDKSFYVKHLLQQHSLVHMDSRNFKCGFCEKSFKLKHHLKQHMAVHGLKSTPEYRQKKSSKSAF